MSLTQRLLLASPIVLVTVLHTAVTVSAFESSTRRSSEAWQGNHPTPTDFLMRQQSNNDPLIPRGCACSRCLQSSQILQGQFPAF